MSSVRHLKLRGVRVVCCCFDPAGGWVVWVAQKSRAKKKCNPCKAAEVEEGNHPCNPCKRWKADCMALSQGGRKAGAFKKFHPSRAQPFTHCSACARSRIALRDFYTEGVRYSCSDGSVKRKRDHVRCWTCSKALRSWTKPWLESQTTNY